MSKMVKITNTRNQPVLTGYRMPGTDANGRANPIVDVLIQPRALLNEVFFPSEAHFLEWKRQNELFITRGDILLDNGNEKEIQAKHSEINKKEKETSDNASNKAVEKIQEAADNVNASVKFTAQETGKRAKK